MSESQIPPDIAAMNSSSVSPHQISPASGNWKAVIGNPNSEPFPAPPVNGINAWVFEMALTCRRKGLSLERAEQIIRNYEPDLRRPFKYDEVERALRKVYSQSKTRPSQPRTPKWSAYDPVAASQVVAISEVRTLAELKSRSAPIPDGSGVDYFIDCLFPGNPLLCAAKEDGSDFLTFRREEARNDLDDATFIVPSPMSAPHGMKVDGSGMSAHTLDNTGPRKYLVVEFDQGENLDHQAAVIGHLMGYAPLSCVSFSGSKSLHAFFHVEKHSQREVIRFFKYAVKLGADDQMWTRCQFARLPGGWNYKTSALQEVYYFNSEAAMDTLPPPPGIPPGYKWELQDASAEWTNDPAEIEAMSASPIIHGLLRDGDAATIVGGAKTQKSWLALHMGICVATGNPFLEYKVWQRRVLYLDYELKDGTFRKRMCMLGNAPPKGLIFMTLRGADKLPLMGDIEELIFEENIGLVILDPLYRTGILQEENSNDTTGRELIALQNIATRTGAALVVVDHTAKGGGNERSAVDAARGASAKGGFFDTIIVLRPKHDSLGANLVTLDAVTRDWPRLTELPVVSFTWDAGHCLVELQGTVSREDPSMVHHRIVEYLRDKGSVGTKDIASALGIAETTLRTALKKLEDTGQVKSTTSPDHSQRKLYSYAGQTEIKPGSEVPDEAQI